MKKWHTLKTEDVLKELNTSEKGLSEEEAKLRLKKFGLNKFLERRKIEPIAIFLRQFKSYFILLLLVATIISAFIEKITDVSVILAILIINAVLGFTQEYKAEKAMEALKKLAAPKAKVIRENRQKEILAEKLIPGDIILLEEGDKVPADARLIEVVSLKTDESSLTGESIPITKEIRALKDVPLTDRKNMVFLGTVVSYGRAKAVVTETGMKTEMGKIAKLIQVKEGEVTPLMKKLNEFVKWMVAIILIISTFTFLIGILRKVEPFEMFLTTIALAVSAVPEGLPAIVTVTLALGMRRMAKNNALIRKLAAVETLGCATVIAADKTGTMTTNEMTVRKLYCNDKIINITKVGFEPRGEFVCDVIINPKEDEHVKLLLRIGLLCNNAALEYKEGRWKIVGDPTEGALLVAAAKADLWKDKIKDYYPCIAELPFSSERKRMSTIHETSDGIFAYVKGAPETILDLCSYIYKNKKEIEFSKKEREKILRITQKLASDGLRVIALAYKKLTKKIFTPEEVEKDLVFVGLAGMIDPPREEVKKAIEICKQAGIEVIMLTGDHKQTALAIARELELIKADSQEAVTGSEIDKLTDKELEERIEKIKVYARVSPEHKVRILKALKKKGHVVAMTGDGVNDAPALKKADVGVAMGIKGTDVAKEASDMILTDDNFATIVKAIEEGRGIYDNIRKFVRFLLSANFDEIFVITLVILVGFPFLPFLPIHILWINLITDGLPALSLSIDPKDPEIMKRNPRNPKEYILSKMFVFIFAAGSLACLATIAVFSLELVNGISLGLQKEFIEGKARTMAFTTAIIFELIFVFNCRSEKHSAFELNPFSNKYLILSIALSILLQLFVIYLPFLQGIFGTVPLNLFDWAKILFFSSFALILSPRIFLA